MEPFSRPADPSRQHKSFPVRSSHQPPPAHRCTSIAGSHSCYTECLLLRLPPATRLCRCSLPSSFAPLLSSASPRRHAPIAISRHRLAPTFGSPRACCAQVESALSHGYELHAWAAALCAHLSNVVFPNWQPTSTSGADGGKGHALDLAALRRTE
eukprot:6190563-Pleurochrysis_carterae.AAC.1